MREKIASLLATLAVLVGGALVVPEVVAPSPASAGTCTLNNGVVQCGKIYHYDAGVSTSIVIQCDYGNPATNRDLWKNQSSKSYCTDTDQVWVRKGQAIYCLYTTDYISGSASWMLAYDSNNQAMREPTLGAYHKISNIWSDGRGCKVVNL